MVATRLFFFANFAKKDEVLFVALLLLSVIAAVSPAGELLEFKISEDQGRYSIEATTLLDAPAAHVRSALNDLVHIYTMSPEITESEILPSADRDSVRIRTQFVACVAFFCNEY